METIELGKSGLRISRLGLGGCPLGGHGWGPRVDESESEAVVRAALDGGVNFFDTADVYGLGRSEELLSRALGRHRHDVVLASKFGVRRNERGESYYDNRPSYLVEALEGSLRRLRVDCIPLYYLHWPDGVTPIAEAVEGLQRVQRAGKIRAIGLSNVSADQLTEAAEVAPIAAVQIQYSLVDRVIAGKLRPAAERLGIPFVTWGSLSQGLLSGKFDANTTFGSDDRRHRYPNFQGERFGALLGAVEGLRSVADRAGATSVQTAIRWLLDSANVAAVLVGAKRAHQVEENLGAVRVRMTERDRRFLTESLLHDDCDARYKKPPAAA